MGNLLGNGTILGDRSEIKERWDQDGSSIVSIQKTAAINETLYTVTAGKTLYIKSIFVQENGTGLGHHFDIKDNATLLVRYVSESTYSYTFMEFKTPLKVSTSIVVATGAAATFNVTLTGWEE